MEPPGGRPTISNESRNFVQFDNLACLIEDRGSFRAANLRRDGFASITTVEAAGSGSLTTVLLTSSGGAEQHLFVNANASTAGASGQEHSGTARLLLIHSDMRLVSMCVHLQLYF